MQTWCSLEMRENLKKSDQDGGGWSLTADTWYWRITDALWTIVQYSANFNFGFAWYVIWLPLCQSKLKFQQRKYLSAQVPESSPLVFPAPKTPTSNRPSWFEVNVINELKYWDKNVQDREYSRTRLDQGPVRPWGTCLMECPPTLFPQPRFPILVPFLPSSLQKKSSRGLSGQIML